MPPVQGTMTRVLLAAAFSLAALAAPAAAHRFGTGCQEDYQNGWQITLPYSWPRCAGFNNRLDDTDTRAFYYNLHNASWWWHDAGDPSTLDSVDIFYNNTHGGAEATRSVWAMWDQSQLADSRSMRLGDDGLGLSVFATYSCKTLKFDDGLVWTRMGSIFRGGLRLAAGSHDLVWSGYTTDHNGEDFAGELQSGKLIWHSWRDANGDWYVDNDVAVAATGTSQADCDNRLHNMTWQNFPLFPRYRDGQIGWACYYYWDNL